MSSLIRQHCFPVAVVAALWGTVQIAHADLLGASTFSNGVVRLDDTTGTSQSGGIAGGFPTGTADMEFPAGVTVGPDGNIYVSSQGSAEILFFDGATGAPLTSPQLNGRAGLFATMPDNSGNDAGPAHLLFGPDGKLYVSDFSGPHVRVFDGATGNFLSNAATVDTNAGGLVFGSDGSLYVGDFSAGKVIRVQNGMQSTFISPGSSSLNTPAAMLFIPGGDMLVLDLYGNQIIRYDENGMNPELFASIPPEVTFPLPDGVTIPSNNPTGMAFDADGNLLVSVLGLTYPPDNRGAILRFDLEGNYLEDQSFTGLEPMGGIAWIASTDAITGDYDSDGDVDSADYAKWGSDFGKWVAVGGGADGNTSGTVNAADYVVWRDHYSPPLVVGTAIPEPTSWAMAFIALLGWHARRRTSARRDSQCRR